MSSAANHRKRSHYSHQAKGAAFSASSRQAFYRDTYDQRNRSILGQLFHRRAPKQASVKETGADQNG